MKKLTTKDAIGNGECELIRRLRNSTTYLAQTLEGKLAFCWAVVEGLVLKLEQQRLDLKPPEIGL